MTTTTHPLLTPAVKARVADQRAALHDQLAQIAREEADRVERIHTISRVNVAQLREMGMGDEGLGLAALRYARLVEGVRREMDARRASIEGRLSALGGVA